ncbi:esterase-like activity of phytase family protein [Labedaea rhizosphaerae]|nr:esterase-like activity of phytase family protein [Labedaea rhizosphaerae]
MAKTRVVLVAAAALALGFGVPAMAAPHDSAAWPGGADVHNADKKDAFGKNLSGLTYENDGVVWAVQNSPGTLYRLTPDGDDWTPDAGRALHYPDGSGDPDGEGVVATPDGLFVSTERDNADGDHSKQQILRFDPSSPAGDVSATGAWDLTADLPTSDPNEGIEAISWVPDSYLTAHGLRDEHTGAAYDPAAYPGHGTGLYVVGLESTGGVYVYALDLGGAGATRITSADTGLPAVMDLEFEPSTGHLWAVCDDTCDGHSVTLDIDGSGAFAVAAEYDRPDDMDNLNNEGFAIAPACGADGKQVLWSDDDNDDGHALRAGTLPCT